MIKALLIALLLAYPVMACDYMEGLDGEKIRDGRKAETGKTYICRKDA